MGLKRISRGIREELEEYPAPDERELTRHLLREMSQKSRVHFYTMPQLLEHEVGADWLWLIFTNAGAHGFLVQAKKLNHIGVDEIYEIRNKVRYLPNEGDYQIKQLMKTADEVGLPAIYVFFTNSMNTFTCGVQDLETEEGVFFDAAKNLYRFAFEEDIRTAMCPELMPITCLFSSIMKKCHYHDLRYVGSKGLCETCTACSEYQDCADENERRRIQAKYKYLVYPKHLLVRTKCQKPFESFLFSKFNMDYGSLSYGREMYLLFWAESVMQRYPSLVLKFMKRGLLLEQGVQVKGQNEETETKRLLDRIQNIVVCEYMNKHDEDYLNALPERDIELDCTTVYEKKKILDILKEKRKKCRLIKKVGLFGSYAKGKATAESDIDIAIRYKKSIYKSKDGADQSREKLMEELLEELIDFLEDVMREFKKNIDFLDYEATRWRKENREFIADIDEYIEWV